MGRKVCTSVGFVGCFGGLRTHREDQLGGDGGEPHAEGATKEKDKLKGSWVVGWVTGRE